MKNNIQSWKSYAPEYHSMSDFSQDLVHTGLALPGIAASLIVKTSKRILDVGCGNGVNTHLLSIAGNIYALGVDPVQEQIDYATFHYSNEYLQFLCSDFHMISDMQSVKFDLITFFGSIDYIPLDEQFFYTLNTLTNSNSRCYISKFHPVWTTLFSNDVGDEICNNSYFDIGRSDIVKFGKSKFHRYHYGIGEMINRFKDAGWNVLELSEPKPNFTNSSFKYKNYDRDPILQQRLARYPMTLIVEFKRR